MATIHYSVGSSPLTLTVLGTSHQLLSTDCYVIPCVEYHSKSLMNSWSGNEWHSSLHGMLISRCYTGYSLTGRRVYRLMNLFLVSTDNLVLRCNRLILSHLPRLALSRGQQFSLNLSPLDHRPVSFSDLWIAHSTKCSLQWNSRTSTSVARCVCPFYDIEQLAFNSLPMILIAAHPRTD